MSIAEIECSSRKWNLRRWWDFCQWSIDGLKQLHFKYQWPGEWVKAGIIALMQLIQSDWMDNKVVWPARAYKSITKMNRSGGWGNTQNVARSVKQQCLTRLLHYQQWLRLIDVYDRCLVLQHFEEPHRDHNADEPWSSLGACAVIHPQAWACEAIHRCMISLCYSVRPKAYTYWWNAFSSLVNVATGQHTVHFVLWPHY